MTTRQAESLRGQINLLAADLRVAETTETRAAIYCRKRRATL